MGSRDADGEVQQEPTPKPLGERKRFGDTETQTGIANGLGPTRHEEELEATFIQHSGRWIYTEHFAAHHKHQ